MTQRSLNEPVTDPLNEEELAVLNAANIGFAQHLGLVITYCSAERLEGYLDVGPQHLQVAGIVNGGVYASIGETLGSAAAIVTTGRPAVGMSNNTDFLRSVSSGRIEAVAIPVHTGRTTHLWRIEMSHEGKLAAITHLKLMLMEI
ncbi:PaaI family thioesterase [Corynebacterium aquatimens]|uniref:PaaI family thioesterase n=1 Tax=Corynebacterium TaxID=1716 RepID=UPI001F2FD708|nr:MULTISPECIES: PaaI family thioesterase [Corynebacterium]QYH19757.1 PaaI family thioesterase [Corynebacterium aquatimens]UIZ93127.1 PaaI family thioesterase [Corynebacterium sp. CNCTC7651]